MTHALIAGALCTTALLIAAYEHFRGARKSGSFSFLIYGIGTLGWTAAGVIADSTLLVVISTAQTAAAFVVAWLGYINKEAVPEGAVNG
jgi:hypothetical protein